MSPFREKAGSYEPPEKPKPPSYLRWLWGKVWVVVLGQLITMALGNAASIVVHGFSRTHVSVFLAVLAFESGIATVAMAVMGSAVRDEYRKEVRKWDQ